MRWPGRRALLWALLLLAWPRAAQAQIPPIPVAPEPRTQQLWDGLVDPCLGVLNALARQGRSPGDAADPAAREALETAWARTLPVLVEIGADPSLALDPDGLAALVDAELRSPRGFASPDEVIAFLEDVAERGRVAVARGTATRPGQLLVAIVWEDPARREAWRYTARNGWLTGAERDAALRTWRAQAGSSAAELTRC